MIVLFDELDKFNEQMLLRCTSLSQRWASPLLKDYLRFSDRKCNVLGIILLLQYIFNNRLVNELPSLRLGLYGKPEMRNLHFNISHSSDAVVLLIDQLFPVGVDIMSFSEADICKEILQFYLCENEISAISDMMDAVKLWTLKEAFSKQIGLGMMFNFKSLDFSKFISVNTFPFLTTSMGTYKIKDYMVSYCGSSCYSIYHMHYEEFFQALRFIESHEM